MVLVFLVPFALCWPLAVVLLMKVAGQGCVCEPRVTGHTVFINSWHISVIQLVARGVEVGINALNEIIKGGEY